MPRPSVIIEDKVLYWTIDIHDTDDTLLDADSVPTINVYKNGVDTSDSVTVTKRAATTGLYDCSYNPAGEVQGDIFTIEETVVIGGTSYYNNWQATVQKDTNTTPPTLTSSEADPDVIDRDGIRRVKTKNMEIEAWDPRIMQAARDKEKSPPSFSECEFDIGVPKRLRTYDPND